MRRWDEDKQNDFISVLALVISIIAIIINIIAIILRFAR